MAVGQPAALGGLSVRRHLDDLGIQRMDGAHGGAYGLGAVFLGLVKYIAVILQVALCHAFPAVIAGPWHLQAAVRPVAPQLHGILPMALHIVEVNIAAHEIPAGVHRVKAPEGQIQFFHSSHLDFLPNTVSFHWA